MLRIIFLWFALPISLLMCLSSCSRQVYSLPQEVSFTLGQSYFLLSVYDDNYLPYTRPSGSAGRGKYNADRHKDTLLDYKGLLPGKGVVLYIPYVAFENTTLKGFTQRGIIPAGLTADGKPAPVLLLCGPQELKKGSGTVRVTIKPEKGAAVMIKQLDLNKGLGNDAMGVILAKFSFKTGNGKTEYLYLRAIPGIPDRNFNDPGHRFLYAPIVSKSGRVWLGTNLGANYNRVDHTGFDPARQAAGAKDRNAYGSLYQWGRYSDGHQSINWDKGGGTPVWGATEKVSPSDTPADAAFIYTPFLNTSPIYDWRSPQNNALWQGAAGINNPCPYGFRVPQKTELDREFEAYGISTAQQAYASLHRFVLAGIRNPYDSSLNLQDVYGFLWSSDIDRTDAFHKSYSSSGPPPFVFNRAMGMSVRCVKE